MELMTEIIRLLLKTVPEQRGNTLRDETAPYYCEENGDAKESVDQTRIAEIFDNIPMP